jgi:hypothetical protein
MVGKNYQEPSATYSVCYGDSENFLEDLSCLIDMDDTSLINRELPNLVNIKCTKSPAPAPTKTHVSAYFTALAEKN